ncbi:MAG: hypothetical protein V7K40_07350 [Nostoc sp.]|uniref:hypothetical protein n=1 Tax=Nostoc sp. TaxID=1180 RepID=UPI002FF490ED
MNFNINSILSVTGTIPSIVLAYIGLSTFIKKPRLSIDVEKSLLVTERNDCVEFEIDIILTSSNKKIFLKEVFISSNQFFSNRKIQLDKIIVCSDNDYIKPIWGTNLIEYCNEPVLGRCSIDQFVKQFGKNVKDIEIDDDYRKKLIFIGKMDIAQKSGSKNSTTLKNWYITIKYQSGTIKKQLN